MKNTEGVETFNTLEALRQIATAVSTEDPQKQLIRLQAENAALRAELDLANARIESLKNKIRMRGWDGLQK